MVVVVAAGAGARALAQHQPARSTLQHRLAESHPPHRAEHALARDAPIAIVRVHKAAARAVLLAALRRDRRIFLDSRRTGHVVHRGGVGVLGREAEGHHIRLLAALEHLHAAQRDGAGYWGGGRRRR